jgi:HlyD family secretion protein/epimerase transport system membrane fusion protein
MDPGDGRRFSFDVRPAILGGLIVIGLAVGGFAGWAATAPIASAVIAPAVVVVDGNRKHVQHLEGGIVKAILVRDGDQVEANQVLLRLEEARARAALGVQQTALDSARILEARLRAERDGAKTLAFPHQLAARRTEQTIAEMMRAQEVLFDARRTSFVGQQDILRQRIARHEQEITGLAAQQEALEQQINFIEEELTGLRDLLKKGIAPKSKVLALEREGARLKGARGERVSEIARAEVSIGATKLEILQVERTFRENVVKELRDVQTQIADLDERIVAAKSTLDHIEIRAPADGVVVGLSAHTTGGVVKPGEVILEIVPSTQRLVVEAQVQPIDIDNVAVGLETEVRLTAFKQRTTPTLFGHVIYVSADRLTENRTGQPYYLARAEMSESELARIKPQIVQPGMPAEAVIKKRERTALDYLIRPVADALVRAWRED